MGGSSSGVQVRFRFSTHSGGASGPGASSTPLQAVPYSAQENMARNTKREAGFIDQSKFGRSAHGRQAQRDEIARADQERLSSKSPCSKRLPDDSKRFCPRRAIAPTAQPVS